ncbi:MAG: ABC transporter substrate-binding protein [Alphaproteobacteria bacterium]|nr:ABC transporter substrate-binding protein [Alphaproteobacteria bacterium]
MSKLELSIAMGDYDRTRAIYDGRVQIDGVDPVCMLQVPEEMFFRAFRHQAYDASEISFSSYVVSLTRPDPHYIAIPVFLSRAFRHTSIYINTTKGIKTPKDLIGKRIGIAEYQLTANVWVRAILEDEYGVKPSDVQWVRGGMDTAGRPEKIKIDLPPDVKLEQAPVGATLNQMLAEGEIDAFVGPRWPRSFNEGDPRVGRLFEDTVGVAEDYYKRTKLFPVMHLLGLRRSLVDQHPWLPGAFQKAFTQAKALSQTALDDTSATKVTMPFVEDTLQRARTLIGQDFWSYGTAQNFKVLDYFLEQHHRQGLSPRRVTVEELFHPSTYEAYSL